MGCHHPQGRAGGLEPRRFHWQRRPARLGLRLRYSGATAMPIIYDELMQAKSTGQAASYTDCETMLYALGIGFMRDPMNKDELKFVYENDLQTVPTMATVVGWGRSSTLAKSGINYLMVVHGEQ